MGYSKDVFDEMRAQTSEKAIANFVKEKEDYFRAVNKKTTKIRTNEYYANMNKFVNDFLEMAAKKVLPELTDRLWGYEVIWGDYVISMNLVKYKEETNYRFEDATQYEEYVVDYSYELYRMEPRLLSAEEYAQVYGVDTQTVTQWIRRGRIRTAKKICNTWMIPELTDLPIKGYHSGMYLLEGDIRPLIDEYSFLKNAHSVWIYQDRKNKSNYIVNINYNNATIEDVGISETIEMSTREKEKFELGLISHPNVRYAPEFSETFLIDALG